MIRAIYERIVAEGQGLAGSGTRSLSEQPPAYQSSARSSGSRAPSGLTTEQLIRGPAEGASSCRALSPPDGRFTPTARGRIEPRTQSSPC